MQIYANWICKNFLIFDACSLDMMIFNPKVTIQKFALLLLSYLKAHASQKYFFMDADFIFLATATFKPIIFLFTFVLEIVVYISTSCNCG